MAKKYISKINKEGNSLYIKDSEARQLIEENSLKILGETSSLDPSATYGKNSLITSDGDVFISTTSVQGLPNNIVTCSGEVVTCNDTTVTCSNNSVAAWVKIVSGQVTANRIAPGAITEGAIADGSITNAKIANNAITTPKIQSYAITSPKLASDSVTASKIANNAVSTGKIADLAVTTNKISDTAVTTDKITNDAITESKIESGAIVGTKIANNAITSSKISNGSVNIDKLAIYPVYTMPSGYSMVVTDDLGDAMSSTDLELLFVSVNNLISLTGKSFILSFESTDVSKQLLVNCNLYRESGDDKVYHIKGIYTDTNISYSVSIMVTTKETASTKEFVTGALFINELIVVNMSIS